MELIERRFEDLSHLKYRMFTCELGGKHHARAMVLEFAGLYGIGSEGNGDADFMRTVTTAALAAWHVHAIVFDMRMLEYHWGDAIVGAFGFGIPSIRIDSMPTAIVVSDLCRQALSTLSSFSPFVPRMFDSLEEAVESVAGPARARLEKMFAELDFPDCENSPKTS